MLKIVINAAVVILSLCYPFLVYFGLQHYDAKILLPVLLMLLGLRWLAGGQNAERKVVIAAVAGIAIVTLVWGNQLGLKFYPVMMNLGFLIVFVSSLFSPRSIVERMARLQDPDLPPHAIAYTRKVTVVWSIFFLINGSIALFTALFATEKTWMLYNGFIAYIFIGLLAAGEWLIRRQVKRKQAD